MQYSVSPRLIFRSFGPKPSEKVRTRTPTRRAIRKWPSSWTKISTPRTNRKARSVVTIAPVSKTLSARRSRGRGEVVRPAVNRPDVAEARDARRAVPLEGVHGQPDDVRNAGKAEPPGEERRHRDLVRGVQHDREALGPAQRPEREPEAREAFGIRVLELETPCPRQVERRQGRRPTDPDTRTHTGWVDACR